MARKPRKPSKKRLTNRDILQQEINKLYRRAVYWAEHKNVFFQDFPVMPPKGKRVTKKQIQAVKDITWKNLPDELKKSANRQYEPPTENDFYNGIQPPQPEEPEWDDSWGEHTDEKYKTDAELDAWIEEKILEITEPTFYNPNVPRELAEQRQEELRNYMYDAELRMGKRNFYEFLQDEEICAQLNHAVTEYVNESEGSNQTSFSVQAFLTILNLGRPLTRDQAETAAFYGRVDFDYTGTKYE